MPPTPSSDQLQQRLDEMQREIEELQRGIEELQRQWLDPTQVAAHLAELLRAGRATE